MQLDDEYRSEVECAMVYAMISGLENSQLKSDDLPEVSALILDELPKATTHQMLMVFLEKLSQRWGIFTSVANVEMARVIERQKAGVVKQMLNQARQGNIDAALKVADTLKPTI